MTVAKLMARWAIPVVLGATAAMVAPAEAGAQGALRGRVLREGSRVPLAGAEVIVAESDLRVTTDSSGAYAFDDMPAGWAQVQVRRVGFAPRRDTINIRGSGPTVHDFVLAPLSQLDTVKSVASLAKYVSPALRAFEERRRTASSGYFIGEEELRKADEKSMAGVIVQRAPGLTAIMPSGNTTNLASTRRECSGPVFRTTCKRCFVTTYIDGQLVYQSGSPADVPPPDFQRIPVNEYAGVEFYPSSATAPVQYNSTGSGSACGVLLLWTRER